MGGHPARLPEIVGAELVGDGDGGCAHGTVLMRTARPDNLLLGIHPDRETHVIL